MLKLSLIFFSWFTNIIFNGLLNIYLIKLFNRINIIRLDVILNEVMNSVYSITSRNNAIISNYGGGFRCKSEYPWCIIEVKNHRNFRFL
ncbi:Uncharacterized protein FWK35_00029776 [Aphis craccivora]|uniref:Uncharacterized protein n=1 Tax=Aphis craccivora TaxID=307492 RepID=A0A6G0Y730_APHCR|nr:Uncharacterized protein FWK35_00029776 [Aphis craccivora]